MIYDRLARQAEGRDEGVNVGMSMPGGLGLGAMAKSTREPWASVPCLAIFLPDFPRSLSAREVIGVPSPLTQRARPATTPVVPAPDALPIGLTAGVRPQPRRGRRLP